MESMKKKKSGPNHRRALVDEEEEEEEWPEPPPALADEEEEEEAPRQQWEELESTEFLQKTNESNQLRTLSSLITKMKNKPNPLTESVKDKKSPLYGKTLQDLQRERDAILARCGGISPHQLDVGRVRLKKTPQKPPKRTPASLMEQAFEQIHARRPSIVVEKGEAEDFSEPYWDPEEWEMEGSALPAGADEMINQLYVALGSIRAGNTSVKLRKGVASLLSTMTKAGVLNELQQRKIVKD